MDDGIWDDRATARIRDTALERTTTDSTRFLWAGDEFARRLNIAGERGIWLPLLRADQSRLDVSRITMVSEWALEAFMPIARPYLLPALAVLYTRLRQAERPSGYTSEEIVKQALWPFQSAFADPERALAAPFGPFVIGLDEKTIPYEIRPPKPPQRRDSRGSNGSSGGHYRWGDYGLVARERPPWARRHRG